MTAPARHRVDDLAATEPPQAGIHSRTLTASGAAKVVLFAFAAGEELSEHTASRPATMHVLSGELEMVIGGEPLAGRPGTWVAMEAGTAHALRARTPAVMLLTLLPGEGS
jgi:quercetin dioxygenase-like cupin family protein